MKTKNIKPNDTVTVLTKERDKANSYFVDSIDENNETALLFHSRYPSILLRVSIHELEISNLLEKGSTERGLDFCFLNMEYLDFNEKEEHEALIIYFTVKRYLTPRMLHSLADMNGHIAKIRLCDDLSEAMKLITKNVPILDQYNKMWYDNFSKLFSGIQPISSKKQRTSIFNIAGFVMGELDSPNFSSPLRAQSTTVRVY